MHERGLAVDHVTVFRWVQRYAPEINGSVAKIIFKRGRSSAALSQAAIWKSEATNFACPRASLAANLLT